MRSLTIGIRTGDRDARRVAKILPLSDGGWALLPGFDPKPSRGFLLLEVPTDYRQKGSVNIPRSSLYREYRSTHGVKLSIHGHGFVQFSRIGADGVLSGTDPVTGKARGFGLQSFPVTEPPRSGPMFGLGAWGLEAYPKLPPSTRGSILFEDEDLYFQSPDRDIDRNAYAVEFWPLPRRVLPAARLHRQKLVLEIPGHPYYADEPFVFVVLDTGHSPMILGVVVTAYVARWQSLSGVTLSSPSDRRLERALTAISPPPHQHQVRSADYRDAWPALPDARRVLLPVRHVPDTGLDRPWGRRRPGAAEQ